jgi:glycosyltransferase involved in cell wall biosynthesis
MSVYKKENPKFFKESMESIAAQTILADEFVLVCDGPLTPELDQVIEEEQKQFGDVLKVFRLKENQGLGRALNAGISRCSNELVARMDSDDISYPDRCRRQLQVFADHPEMAVTSGTVEEFYEDPAQVTSCRSLPRTSEEILAFAKKRNPFNHPCVMYRKSAVEAAGGYRDFYLLEDYDLWIRMLHAGYQGYNLQEPLLKMRSGRDMYKRRSGLRYARSQAALFGYMKEIGWIGTIGYVKSVTIRGISSLMPNVLRKFLFETILRNKAQGV